VGAAVGDLVGAAVGACKRWRHLHRHSSKRQSLAHASRCKHAELEINTLHANSVQTFTDECSHQHSWLGCGTGHRSQQHHDASTMYRHRASTWSASAQPIPGGSSSSRSQPRAQPAHNADGTRMHHHCWIWEEPALVGAADGDMVGAAVGAFVGAVVGTCTRKIK